MNDRMTFSSTYPSSHDVESTLVAYDPYVVSLMRNSSFTHLSFMDRDDLTQLVRIKMMQALQKRSIRNLSKYLKSIAHNEYVSFIRRQKPTVSLFASDEEEREDEPVSTKEGFRDPQVEYAATTSYNERLETIVRTIMALPKVQMRVAVCFIRDRMDDPLSLIDAFRQHNLDISMLQWPTDPKEKQCLQASYTPVRKKLAQALGIDLALFKGRGAARISCV